MQLPLAMPRNLSCGCEPHVKKFCKPLVTCSKTLTLGNKYTLLTVYKGTKQQDELFAEGLLVMPVWTTEGTQKNPQSLFQELDMQLYIVYTEWLTECGLQSSNSFVITNLTDMFMCKQGKYILILSSVTLTYRMLKESHLFKTSSKD